MVFTPQNATTENTANTFVPQNAKRVNEKTKDVPEKSFFGKIADFIGLGSTVETMNLIAGSPILGKTADQTDLAIQELGKQSRKLIAQSRTEADPNKKKALLQQSRDIDAQIEDAGSNIRSYADNLQAQGGITERDMNRSNGDLAFRKGLASATEIGSLLLPATKGAQSIYGLAKGGNWLAKAVANGTVSATSASILGFGSESNEGLDQRLKTAVESGLFAGAISSFLTSGFEGAKWSIGKAGESLNWLKDKIGRQQLGQAMGLTDTLIKEADRLGIDPSEELLSRDMVNNKTFSRVKKLIEYKNGQKTEKFIYGGQEQANNLIKQQERIIQDKIDKSGNKIVATKTKLLDGIAEFIGLNSTTDAEAKSAIKFANDAVNRASGGGEKISAETALFAKRELYKTYSNITDKSSLKRKVGERIAAMFNRELKNNVEGVSDALRQEQILIALRDDFIPHAGRAIYKNAQKSLFGLSPGEASSIMRASLAPVVAGNSIGGPIGAMAGLATQVPSVISKVSGPEQIASRLLQNQSSKVISQPSGTILNTIGSMIYGRAGERITEQ